MLYLRRTKLLKVFQYLVFSNVLISFGAACFLSSSFLLLGKPIDFIAIAFVFVSTLFTYNLQRLHKLKFQFSVNGNDRLQWIYRHKDWIQFLVYGLGLLLIGFFPFLSWTEIIGLGFLGFFSFFYSFPTKFGNLRSIPRLKIFLIALVWSGTAFIFTWDRSIGEKDVFLFTYNFLFILGITIPFDIRDLKFDKESYQTIPQMIGLLHSKVLSFFLVVLSYFFLSYLLEYYSILLAVVYLSIALFCFGSSTRKPELYFSGLIDSSLCIVFLFLWLLH